MATIRIVHAQPKMAAVAVEVENSLEALQGLVGGDIAWFGGFEPLTMAGLHTYINDDGRRLGLDLNCVVGTGTQDVIVGPIVVSKVDAAGDEIGLTSTDAVFAAAFLNRVRIAQALLVPTSREEFNVALAPVRADHDSHRELVVGCPFCEGAIT
jgi:hypothetical protein